MSSDIRQQVQGFFQDDAAPEWVAKNKRDTLDFIEANIGSLTLTDEGESSKWLATLLGGQNIGNACLAAYYLTSASEIPVQFDANGTRFLISEIAQSKR